MFEKSLSDLIRGIRANKRKEEAYIATCIEEIRKELKQNDPHLKAQAVSKLTYLHMLGYEMAWASFHVVEVMSSPNFGNKRIGYLAATQSFRQDTDVLMLTTNLLRKDLASSNHLEVGVAINGFSHILTPDLARDLCQDLVGMLNHSRPYVRKRVVLALYKVFLKFPEGLRITWPKLKERLEDEDHSVVSATVNVVCELACHNPENYLVLAPHLFQLLTTSSNNWMLIKIVKLFASLTPLEPRLAKKLLAPITNLIQTTPAMSLLYECILTVVGGGMLGLGEGAGGGALAKICIDKLRTFLQDADQNLKYIGLLALRKIQDVHPALVADHGDVVLQCVDDPDYSIRMRALDLVTAMVTRKNLVEIVNQLMTHLKPAPAPLPTAVSSLQSAANTSPKTWSAPSIPVFLDASYRADIIRRIISACSRDEYAFVGSFEWYMSVLVELAYAASKNTAPGVGTVIASQMVDVAVRVKSVRSTAVRLMTKLVSDAEFLEAATKHPSNADVLDGAAWIIGEYCSFVPSPAETLTYLIQPLVSNIPATIQSVYVHNALKMYIHWIGNLSYWSEDVKEDVRVVTNLMKEGLKPFTVSEDLEVQERACSALRILEIVEAIPSPTMSQSPPTEFAALKPLFFSADLNPVALRAQSKVPAPEGLDLNAWIFPEAAESDIAQYYEVGGLGSGSTDDMRLDTGAGNWGDVMFEGGGIDVGRKRIPSGTGGKLKGTEEREMTAEERLQSRMARNARIANDPFYIPSTSSNFENPRTDRNDDDVDAIPIVHLTIADVVQEQKSSKSRRGHGRSSSPSPPPPQIDRGGEMPEDAVMSADDDDMDYTQEIVYKKPKKSKKKEGVSLGKKKGETAGFRSRTGKKDVLDTDRAALRNIDLQTPLGEDERLPSIAAYKSPEALRLQEEAKWRERNAVPKETTALADESEAVMSMVKKKKKKKKSNDDGTDVVQCTKVAKKRRKPKEGISHKLGGFETAPHVRLVKQDECLQLSCSVSHAFRSESDSPSTAELHCELHMSILPADHMRSSIIETVEVEIDPTKLRGVVLSLGPNAERGGMRYIMPGSIIAGREQHGQKVDVWFKEAGAVWDESEESDDVRRSESANEDGEDSRRKKMKKRRRVGGIVNYTVRDTDPQNEEDEGEKIPSKHRLFFTIPLPASGFILPNPSPPTPEAFAYMIGETGRFPHHASTLVRVRPWPGKGMDGFRAAANRMAEGLLRLRIVEDVESAITVYGRSVQGYEVAGLMKMVSEDGVDGGLVTVELKCSSRMFAEALVWEVEEIWEKVDQTERK